MNKVLTTTDVPEHFLTSAFLVGHIPQKALSSDPRISYALYVPPDKYTSRPDQKDPMRGKLDLLVYVHGTRRNLSAMHTVLAPFADSAPCAVLAPLFPAGLDTPNDLSSYKVLKSPSLRSDLAFLSMLDEIAYRWPGIRTDKVFLMGFSGGGQFAHRFLYLYPERLIAVSIGAPGSVTLLDPQRSWPKGTADVEALFDRSVKRDMMKRVAVQLIVGSEDTEIHGGEDFWVWLQQSRNFTGTTEAGGSSVERNASHSFTHRGRLQVLRDLQKNLSENGVDSQLEVVDGIAHTSAAASPFMLHFLQSRIRDKKSDE